MRITRRSKPPIVRGPVLPEPTPTMPDTTLLREELTRVLVEEAEDPVLLKKFRQATEAGMPVPDLHDVPKYKRLQAIDDAVDNYLALVAGGPCSYCGSRRPRYAPGQSEEPRFTTSAGTLRACEWCADAVSDGGADHLRERVGNAAIGVWGLPPGGSFYRFASPELVPFFHEVGGGDGTPWSHITQDAHRLQKLRVQAFAKVHPSRFCRTQGDCTRVAVPGIVTAPWTEDQIPKPPQKFIPLSRKGQALEEENRRALQALREERAQREQQTARRLARLAERDAEIEARLAAMSDDERAAYLETLATVPSPTYR